MFHGILPNGGSRPVVGGKKADPLILINLIPGGKGGHQERIVNNAKFFRSTPAKAAHVPHLK
jgi:hypothetical protein